MPKTLEALEKWQDQEPNHTAFALVAGSEQSAYEMMEAQPGFAARFTKAMTSFAKLSTRSSHEPRFIHAKPFQNLGKATIVDISGSRGIYAMLLAQKYPDLRFIVQDLAPAVAGAEAAIPPPLQNRIDFMSYSFFSSQTVAADVYLFKQCFHNWPDHYRVRIIKNQILVMKRGSKIIVIDSLIPAPGTISLMRERMTR